MLFITLPLLAEHVFEAGVHGGVAGWNAQSNYVSPRVGFHGGAQIYYTYFSPRIIGFRTGATFDYHQPGFGKLNYEDT